LKDGNNGGTKTNDTNWSQCGNKTVYYSASTLNGVLLCMDASRAKRESSRGGNLMASSYNEMLLNESWKPDLSNLTFKKPSQWSYIPQHIDD